MTYEPPQGEPAGRGAPGGPSLAVAATIIVVIALVLAAAFWGPWATDAGNAPREGIGIQSDDDVVPTPADPGSYRAPVDGVALR